MKLYKLVPTRRFIEQLKKLDKFTQKQITHYLEMHVTINPRQHGKVLSTDRSGKWRYRIGNYRVIVEICDDKLVIETLEVGHRRDIY